MQDETTSDPPSAPEASGVPPTNATETDTTVGGVGIPAADMPRSGPEGRRMPEHVRRHLMRLRDGQYYLPAAYRVVWFREECPDWAIMTELLEGGFEAGWATVKATVMTADGRVVATGMKTESKGDFPAGWVEKAETGAVGRALALAGYGTQFGPDLDDMAPPPTARPHSGGRSREAAQKPGPMRQPATTWPGPGQCPQCHAPAGKPHGSPCCG